MKSKGKCIKYLKQKPFDLNTSKRTVDIWKKIDKIGKRYYIYA